MPIAHGFVKTTAVGQPRLREHDTARWRPTHPHPPAERWLRKVEQLGATRANLGIASLGHIRVRCLDDGPKAHRQLDERPHVRAALGFVGIEQRLAGSARHHHLQLPGEVGCIPNTGAHALPEKRRRLVRTVTGQQYSTAAPRDGDQ